MGFGSRVRRTDDFSCDNGCMSWNRWASLPHVVEYPQFQKLRLVRGPQLLYRLEASHGKHAKINKCAVSTFPMPTFSVDIIPIKSSSKISKNYIWCFYPTFLCFSQGFYSSSFGNIQLSSSTENTVSVMYIGALVWCLFRIPFNCLVFLMMSPRIFSSFGSKKGSSFGSCLWSGCWRGGFFFFWEDLLL